MIARSSCSPHRSTHVLEGPIAEFPARGRLVGRRPVALHRHVVLGVLRDLQRGTERFRRSPEPANRHRAMGQGRRGTPSNNSGRSANSRPHVDDDEVVDPRQHLEIPVFISIVAMAVSSWRSLFRAYAREESSAGGVRCSVFAARAPLVLGHSGQRLFDVVTTSLPRRLATLLACCAPAHIGTALPLSG